MPRKRYVGLAHVLRHLDGDGATEHRVYLENRPERYNFGARNYGEVCANWHNRADGDKWDVFAPGYDHTLPVDCTYAVEGVLGVLRLDNGNHKIAVRLRARGYDAERARREIEHYVHRYTTRVRVRGEWHPLSATSV